MNGEIAKSYPALTIRSSRYWLLLIVSLISLPYIIGWLVTPKDMVFSWALLNPDDMGVYVSAMRQGAAGKWLYHFTYSPEAWQPRLMLALYLILGKITAIFTVPTVIILHLWRTLFAIFAIWALIFWCRTIFPKNTRTQWTAWLLILFSGGFGWLAILVMPSAVGHLPDITSAENVVLISLFNTPHFALGIGLIALFFSFFWRTMMNTRYAVRWAFVASFIAILTILTYVYHLAVIGLVIGMYMLLIAIKKRTIPWIEWRLGAIIIIPLLPFLAYYLFGTNNDPYWIQYTEIDHVIPPSPWWGFLIGLGGVGLLALIGSWHWLVNEKLILLPLWALAQIGLLYFSGVQFSGRFALGLSIPIASLAAIGLENELLPRLSLYINHRKLKRFVPVPYETVRRLILILLAPSIIMSVLLFIQGPFLQQAFPYYLSEADIVASEWLGNEVDETAVIFTYYPIGNYLPRVYDGKVFMGQLDYTTNLNEKTLLYEQFWTDMTSLQQNKFLDEWGITHVMAGSYDVPFMSTEATLSYPIIYQKNNVTIWDIK